MRFSILFICVTLPALGASNEDLASCQQTNDLDKSIAACSRVIIDKEEKDADRAVMYLYRGTAHMTKGDLNRAIADFDQTLRLDPVNVFAYLNRSIAYNRKGDYDRSKSDYRRAASLDSLQVAAMIAGNDELKTIQDLSKQGQNSEASALNDPIANLKIVVFSSDRSPIYIGLKEWAADVEKASGGSIKTTFQTLSAPQFHYVSNGKADLGFDTWAVEEGVTRVDTLADFPFTFGDAVKSSQALDIWYRRHGFNNDQTNLCLAFVQPPVTLHFRQKATVPADLQGLKIGLSSPGNSPSLDLIFSLGGTFEMQPLDVDAMIGSWSSISSQNTKNIFKYHIDFPFSTLHFEFRVNKAKYLSLTPGQRTVLDSHCTTQWAARIVRGWEHYEDSVRDGLRADPAQDVYRLTSAQFAAWKSAASNLERRKEWSAAEKAKGADPAAIERDLRELVVRYGADEGLK